MGNMCEYHARNINNEQNIQPKLLAQHRFQDIGIYLDAGDIKNEEVDVIVAQTDLNLKLPYYLINNVSPQTKQQLLKYIQQIRDKQAVSHGDVVHSHAAELEFDFVFYCILPNEDDEPMKLARNHNPKNLNLKLPKNAHQKYQKQFIYDCMMTCLKVAEEMEITSICFPVMKSTKFTISTIATMQMIAVKNFLEENVTKIKFLSQVRFCIQDDKDQELFKWAFDKVFMDTDDSSEASDEDSLNNNSGGNSGSGSAGNSLSKNTLYELQPTVKKPQQKNFEEDEFVKSFGANYYDKFESPQSVSRKLSI
ncbi:unnamed protein product [Paramecium primaurelia]|uniref:Macro domain-containing protein n=2 Tax=Paramecium TaxID=5884 RepID=A0A8S1UH04_9CILI|nr:unnamed protein product [Paramecium primaurelia]CAD8164288.1 unnamed protein product [Paramecium pentaurelia]